MPLTIIVYILTERVVHELVDIRGGPKGNLISRAIPMCMLTQAIRYTKPKWKGV